ncbi:MAG: ADP-ribosylation factor-like protein [Candidatus Odinarchaeota archaeon]
MLHNIFLFKGNKIRDLVDLNIFCYPNEIISIDDKLLVNKIIKKHENENCFQQLNSKHAIDEPVAQFLNDLNIYTCCINGKIIIGLIFENDDNPYDYREIFKELLNEVLNNGNGYSFDDEIEIDNLLISMFIDIRRFGDEVIEKPLDIEYYYQRETFFKIFLFGIDEVGKSSLIRRMKTGKFNDNFFVPTRKFNIEYIPVKEKGLLAVWDMPGQKMFRSKWLKGLQDSNILIYMIDIANQRRFEESRKEFWKIINKDELNGIPLLILGNKFDLIKYSEKDNNEQLTILKKELFNFYNFNKIKNRKWNFIFTSVKTNFNIDEIIPKIFNLLSS